MEKCIVAGCTVMLKDGTGLSSHLRNHVKKGDLTATQMKEYFKKRAKERPRKEKAEVKDKIAHKIARALRAAIIVACPGCGLNLAEARTKLGLKKDYQMAACYACGMHLTEVDSILKQNTLEKIHA
jgi:hypothetical protein